MGVKKKAEKKGKNYAAHICLDVHRGLFWVQYNEFNQRHLLSQTIIYTCSLFS